MNMLLWTTHVTKADFANMAKIKKAGYDGVELPLFEGEDGHFEMIRKELDRLKLGCTTVTVSSPEANPISPDKKIRAAALADIKKKIRHSQILGSDVLVGPYHSPLGEFPGRGPTEDECKWAAEVHYAAAEFAQACGVRLGIEYLNRFECYFMNTAEQAVAHVKRVNHPWFGTMYDTFHANIEEKDPIKAFTKNAKHYFHFHVSENDRGTPGKGHVDWPGIFKALRKAKYDHWLTIEAFGRALPALAAATRVWRDFFPNREEVYTKGIKFIRKMWNESA